MRTNVMLRTALFLALASAARAQLGGPVLGYLPDGDSLRTMYGLPAAGAVGAALNTGRAFAVSAVSPSQNFALGVAADTGELLLVVPGADGSAAVSPVGGAAAGASSIVLSPSGSAAAVWLPSLRHAQVIGGLPGSSAVREIDASFLNADPATLAVSDDAQWFVGSWAQGLYAFGPDGQVVQLPVYASVQALSFFHRSATLFVATATQAGTIADIGGSGMATVVWSAPETGAPAGALAGAGVSFDNASAVLAWSSGALVTVNLATDASATADCGCAPAGLFGLGGSVFRLTGLDSGALKVFDAATGEMWFVPRAASSADGGQQ